MSENIFSDFFGQPEEVAHRAQSFGFSFCVISASIRSVMVVWTVSIRFKKVVREQKSPKKAT